MSQEELAKKTVYKTNGAISRIENGKRDINQSQIKIFAKALDVSPEFLLLGEPMEKPKTIEDIDFTGIDRIAAHYKGEEFSKESLEAIQDFVEYVKSKKNKDKK